MDQLDLDPCTYNLEVTFTQDCELVISLRSHHDVTEALIKCAKRQIHQG